jgi:glutaredoxin
MTPAAPLITVYTTPDCHLCEEAVAKLRAIEAELGFELTALDITTDDDLHRAYMERVPVVLLDGEELCEYFVDEALVRERLESRR